MSHTNGYTHVLYDGEFIDLTDDTEPQSTIDEDVLFNGIIPPQEPPAVANETTKASINHHTKINNNKQSPYNASNNKNSTLFSEKAHRTRTIYERAGHVVLSPSPKEVRSKKFPIDDPPTVRLPDDDDDIVILPNGPQTKPTSEPKPPRLKILDPASVKENAVKNKPSGDCTLQAAQNKMCGEKLLSLLQSVTKAAPYQPKVAMGKPENVGQNAGVRMAVPSPAGPKVIRLHSVLDPNSKTTLKSAGKVERQSFRPKTSMPGKKVLRTTPSHMTVPASIKAKMVSIQRKMPPLVISLGKLGKIEGLSQATILKSLHTRNVKNLSHVENANISNIKTVSVNQGETKKSGPKNKPDNQISTSGIDKCATTVPLQEVSAWQTEQSDRESTKENSALAQIVIQDVYTADDTSVTTKSPTAPDPVIFEKAKQRHVKPPQKDVNLAEIVETASAVAAITPTAQGNIDGAKKGNVMYFLYPISPNSDTPGAPFQAGQLQQVLALVPAGSKFAAPSSTPEIDKSKKTDFDLMPPPTVKRVAKDTPNEIINVEMQTVSRADSPQREDPRPKNQQEGLNWMAPGQTNEAIPDEPPPNDVEVEPAPVVIPVDILQILNRGKKPEVEPRCQYHKTPHKGAHFLGFTRPEKRASSCVRDLKNIIKTEAKKITKLKKKMAAEDRSTNIVYCGSATGYFLPETARSEIDEGGGSGQIGGDLAETELLPTISEVVSKVNEQVLHMKRNRGTTKKSTSKSLSGPEEALHLIKMGLEMIQGWSHGVEKKDEVEVSTLVEKPVRGRKPRMKGKLENGNVKKNAVREVTSAIAVAKKRRLPTTMADDDNDDLLVVKRVDIIKNAVEVKRRGRKKKM